MNVKRITAIETHALRHLVLWPHLGHEDDCIIDIDGREDAMHYGVLEENDIVAIGSFFQMSTPKLNAHFPYRLRAMAVHPSHRGQHFGQALIRQACLDLKQRHADILWCDARIGAVPFYQSMGFDMHPEVYQIPIIGPHQFMWLTL
jgi:GNAT superfamily N-acetyltransferase